MSNHSASPSSSEQPSADHAVRIRPWLCATLRLAAVYNVVWGAVVILFPGLFFRLAGMEPPLYPEIWQCVGMIVGVYGVGYWVAASDPVRHWPIVLVGLLGKIFGPIGFAIALAKGTFPPVFALTIVTNDLVWWVPFGLILWAAFRARASRPPPASIAPLRAELSRARDQHGRSLLELSESSAVLVVLLRHSGCTFCREALADLREARSGVEGEGTAIAVVHMSTDGEARKLLRRFDLEGVARVSDPERRLYAAFELGHGTFAQLFGLKPLVRGIGAALRGYLPGPLDNDGFQMPGVFLVRDGSIVRAYRHTTAADRPAYARLASAPAPTS